MEIYKKYRPSDFDGMIGQEDAIRVLQNKLAKKDLPHALLFVGPSGCGKTTLARILRKKLKCSESDFNEMNCADFRGVDMVREIRSRMGLAPLGGSCRIWVIDEAQSLTKDAQQALLKILEDTPRHVYFLLCTTDPTKLLGTIKTRCTEVRVKPLTDSIMMKLLMGIAAKEKRKYSDEVLSRIIEVSDGSPRKALVALDAILEIEGEEDQLDCILSSDSRKQAIDLARLLVSPRVKWTEVQKLLKELAGEEAESIRHLVLGYAKSVLLGNKAQLHPKSYLILVAFEQNFWDTKMAGLVRACYEVVTSK